MTDDYDSPWKDILERYFSQFMAFFFPEAHADIDWSRGYESLDTELQQIVRDAESGKRLADKLIKVWRRSGAEQIVLIHIEVQGETDTRFGERMFVYHYRLYDRYRQPIVSLAVLGDDSPTWRPGRYATELWGCQTLLRFPIVKLTDYTQRWDELTASRNPFAVVVMTHLKTRATRHDFDERLRWKLALVKGLHDKGYGREDVLELFRFMDWLLYLPDELARQFTQQLTEYEAAMSKPYITSVERQGIEKGVLEGLQRGLDAERALLVRLFQRRFDVSAAGQFAELLQTVDDSDQLADIGEWLIESKTGTELIERVQKLVNYG